MTLIFQNKILWLWHVDPERDGTDDSCGWFIRARHCDKTKLEKLKKRFKSEWGTWRENKIGYQATILEMFNVASRIYFNESWSKSTRFMRKYLFDILLFSENGVDSLHVNFDLREPWEMADIIYAWIARIDRPWYKHPRWHFWHWRLRLEFVLALKRRYWDKCCKCGKRGFPPGCGGAFGSWNNNDLWHGNCDSTRVVGQGTVDNGPGSNS